MKRVKIVLWVVFIAFFLLLIYQNQELFFPRQSLGINMYFFAYQTPEIPAIVFHISFFVLGLLIAFFFGLAQRIRSKKTIKNLNATIESQGQPVSGVKEEPAAGPKEDAPIRISTTPK
ncbi:MAG: LapA family protein [Thermodesulfobacteriota bacterium]